ncbi:MAG: patatin-like phospholipase family protein [Cyclobacteriaceae bacterium]
MFGFGNKKPKWGIALGGGGARGYAHLGVLEALREKGIEPDIISGVSAGAIAGAFISSGKTPREAFEIIKEYRFTDFTKFRIPRNGLLSLEKLKARLKEEIEQENIEDLKIPLVIAVSNILKGKVEYLDSGPLADIVEASASIPVLFSPVQLEGGLYCDGGLFDNLPITPLRKKCKNIIAVSISPVNELDTISGILEIAARTFQLSVNHGIHKIKKSCKVFIEPTGLYEYDIMDTKHADEIFKLGYDHVKQMDISS